VGTIVGSVIGALVLVALAGGVAYYYIIYKKNRIIPRNEETAEEVEATVF
jgi:hypothetical protein